MIPIIFEQNNSILCYIEYQMILELLYISIIYHEMLIHQILI